MRKIVLVMAFLGLLVRSAGADDHPATSRVSAKLRVTGDQTSPLLDNNLLVRAMGGESRVLLAIKKVVPDFKLQSPVYDVVRVALVPGFDVTIPGVRVLNYDVESFDARIDAKAVLDELGKMLNRDLLELDVESKREHALLAEGRSRLEGVTKELLIKQLGFAELCAAHGVDVDAAITAQKRLQLETEYQRLIVDLTGVVARQVVIEQQIASYGQQASKIEGADLAILQELTKSVTAHQRIVQFHQQAFSAGSPGGLVADVERAKDELAKAEAELARHRRAVAADAGGRRIDELRQRLDDTNIERQELLAKKVALSEIRDKVTSRSAEIDLQRIQVEMLQEEYRERAAELRKLDAAVLRHVAPKVEIDVEDPGAQKESPQLPEVPGK